MKKGLAVLLAVLLMCQSTMPMLATEIVTEEVTEEATEEVTEEATEEVTEEATEEVTEEATEEVTEEATEEVTEEATEEVTEEATEEVTEEVTEEAAEEIIGEETEEASEVETESVISDKILFNTGNCEWSITDENGDGDDYFAEDGDYTIYIPEANPFFPYEVQFTHNGVVTTEWFMTPDDSVTIGNHTFYVVGQFDNETVTQMTLNVGGDTVIVYPEKKEFTNDGGMQTYSLLPLEEKRLSVDLSSYTPVELTMVSVDAIFTGENKLENTDYLMWTHTYDDDFKVNVTGDRLNFSSGASYSSSQTWQMIVGDDNQLAADNIRYILNVNVTPASEWLVPTVYMQAEDGSRSKVNNLRNLYSDSYADDLSRMYLYLSNDEVDNSKDLYLSYTVNPELYTTQNYAEMKVYEGAYTNPTEVLAAKDITAQVMCTNMDQKDVGYAIELYKEKDITFVTFDTEGNITGCLPVKCNIYTQSDSFLFSIYERTENDLQHVQAKQSTTYWSDNSKRDCIIELYKEYPANQKYVVKGDFFRLGENNNDLVTAAYVGSYTSIAEAVAVGAVDIKDQIFSNYYSNDGYEAVFNEGIDFTFIIGEDGSENQCIYYYNIKTETGETSSGRVDSEDMLSSNTDVYFNGLRDKDGKRIECYVVSSREDSYAEYNYLTILVPAGVDLTNIAPTFYTYDNAKVYAAGSNAPEESGVSLHNFSNGPVQYTVSAENGEVSKNYWLNVISAKDGMAELYINSLFDESANVRKENGIIYAAREVMLDGYHNDIHDILVANVGTEALGALSVTLVSDVVELDRYWTLSGEYALSGLNSVDRDTSYGELANLAKIRLITKDGVEAGTEIKGTLTIKSGEKTLVVLELTGLIGDPIITTEEIPSTVKYVPYGTMIQNNNKYSWNRISYQLIDGELPSGMELKSNGEIYGVPTETGEFAFSVMMNNSHSSFTSDIAEFVLLIKDNTAENVNAVTDEGYQLSSRIVDLNTTTAESQTLVSEGNYAEFVDVYIDGIKLIENEDYISEEGSTRITISSQTLAEAGDQTQNSHTIGIEFRTLGTGTLKRAAQNYEVVDQIKDDGDGNVGDGNVGNGNGNANIGNGSFGMNTLPVDHYIAGPKETTSYVISTGDTLWSIAEKYYGSGNYWTHIYEMNKEVITDPNKIFVGQKISLTPVIGTNSNEANKNVVSEEGTYVIVSGDNLWKVAKKVYGKGWKWRQIYEANKTVISNPEQIYVGQVIQIPIE